MIKGTASISSNGDNRAKLEKIIKGFANMQVYVGIPDGDQGDHDGITNAELLYALTNGVRAESMRDEMQPVLDSGVKYTKAHEMYIHEHGSPLWHTPPRPVLEPAIEANKEMIAKQLKQAAVVTLDGNDPTADLQKAGMVGMNVARDWFTNQDNEWPANAPSTIKAKGSDRPNIDTGELRKSITYVVKTHD